MKNGTESGPRVLNLPVKDDLAAEMEEMERNLPQLRRYYGNRARLARAYYESLVEAGFSADDALELVEFEFSS